MSPIFLEGMRPGKELNIYIYIYIYIYLAADFLKTNLMKFAVIGMTRRQKVGFFLSPTSPTFTVTKKKERRKRKSEEEERRRRGKKQRLHC